jgi:uncharacterized protein YfaS (alpha-2-macroglobulin family)
LPPHLFATDEPIRVTVKTTDKDGKPVDAPATVVAMRLLPQAQTPVYYGNQIYQSSMPYQLQLNNYNGIYRGSRGYNGRGIRANQLAQWDPLWKPISGSWTTKYQREMVTATVVENNQATVRFDTPGAYKLVCIAQMPDGTKVKEEVGCVVRSVAAMPGLVLRLDRELYETGDTLEGTIHSRFAGANVLLTVCDSTGVRFWKTFTMDGATQRIRERLPRGLHYGASVTVQYVAADFENHVAARFIRVAPKDRMLTIDAKVNEIYEPGQEVEMELSVNRNEPVDLVVSVFDQSLLGIRADKSPDIRNFYLADERVRFTAGQDILRRQLAGVTVRELVEKAEKLLKDTPHFKSTPEGQMLTTVVSHYRSSRYVYGYYLPSLLRLAGVQVYVDQMYRNYYGHHWYWRYDQKVEDSAPALVTDMLNYRHDQWEMRCGLVGGRLTLCEYHPTYTKQWYDRYRARGAFAGYGGYQMRGARGDGRYSHSANGMFSHTQNQVSGQSFISHVPPAGASAAPVALIEADASDISVRRDFSDSAFFKANVRTDDKGKALVKFKLPDSLTNWRVVVTAVSRKMHVGQLKTRFRTFKPIMVWPMLPRVFAEGDEVQLYGSVHNRTDKPQRIEVSLKVENGKIVGRNKTSVVVPPKENRPVYWTFAPDKAGFTQLLMTARCEAGSDASLKRLPVSRVAAEQVVSRSGFCRNETTIEIPTDVEMADSAFTVTFIPTLADDMVQSLDYLVQYPHGCVEQTMSKFLPAIKVAQTLKRINVENKALEAKLPAVVDKGMKRLLELQKPDGGWGWHGGSQTHEMMTPYALYGLLQAEQAGYKVPNETAVQKGLNRLSQFIGGMNEKQTADRIYCMYVWSHRSNLQPEWWAFIEDQLGKDKLSDYALALSLEMAVKKGGADREALADKLAEALRKRANKSEGAAYWTTAGFSRWGNDRFEITAAVLKAFVAYDPEDELIESAIVFFARTKHGNRWNSTKSTAMIIFAMCDYLATQDYAPGKAHHVGMQVNGGEWRRVLLAPGTLPKIEIPGHKLHHGKNSLRFEGHVPGAMYRATFCYWKEGKTIERMAHGINVVRRFYLLDDAGNQIREIVSGETVPRGSYIRSMVSAIHSLKQPMRYVLVENPKPASCEILPSTDTRFNKQASTAYALREDKTLGVVYHHESTGSAISDVCVLHAELAGDYIVPPASVELMYETEIRGHSGTFTLSVADE